MRHARSRVWLTSVGVAFLLVFTASPGARVTAANVPPAAVTDAPPQDILHAYLKVQAELQATQFALERNRQEAETAAPRNAELLDPRPRLLEQALVSERTRAFDSVERSQQLLLIFAGVFAGVGLLAILLTAYLQWRSTERLAGLGAALPALPAPAQAAAFARLGPGAAPVAPLGQTETANVPSLRVIERLEKRIQEMEQTARPALAAPSVSTASPAPPPPPGAPSAEALMARADEEIKAAQIEVLLSKGQTQLALERAEEALACFDEALKLDPQHPKALVKRGAALEQARQPDEAIRLLRPRDCGRPRVQDGLHAKGQPVKPPQTLRRSVPVLRGGAESAGEKRRGGMIVASSAS